MDIILDARRKTAALQLQSLLYTRTYVVRKLWVHVLHRHS